MVARLSRQDAGGQQPAQREIPGTDQQGTSAAVAPKGWGKRGVAAEAAPAQREAIAEKLAPPNGAGSPSEQATAAFSGSAREQIGNIQNGDYGGTGPVNQVQAADPAAPTRRRRAAAPPSESGSDALNIANRAEHHDKGAEWNNAPQIAALAAATEFAGLMQARARVLQVVFSDPNETLEIGLEMAREMMEFIVRG